MDYKKECPNCGGNNTIILDELPCYQKTWEYNQGYAFKLSLEFSPTRTGYYYNCVDCDYEWDTWSFLRKEHDLVSDVKKHRRQYGKA